MNDLGLTEVTDYLILPPIWRQVVVSFYMYQPLWDEIPEDIQTVFKMAVRDFDKGHTAYRWELRQKAYREVVTEGGFNVNMLPDSDVKILEEAAVEILDEAAEADADSAAAVQMLKDFLGW
jgi:TRAP-type mannitol/chloroaromatic compound transport system substrate-binding protein